MKLFKLGSDNDDAIYVLAPSEAELPSILAATIREYPTACAWTGFGITPWPPGTLTMMNDADVLSEAGIDITNVREIDLSAAGVIGYREHYD